MAHRNSSNKRTKHSKRVETMRIQTQARRFLKDASEELLESLAEAFEAFCNKHPSGASNPDVRSHFRGAFFREKRRRHHRRFRTKKLLNPNFDSWKPEWPFNFDEYFHREDTLSLKELFQQHQIPTQFDSTTFEMLAQIDDPLARHLLLYCYQRGTSLERFGLEFRMGIPAQQLEQVCRKALDDASHGENHRLANFVLLYLPEDRT